MTIIKNSHKSMDELSTAIMMSSVYFFGTFNMAYFQIHYKEVQAIMKYANQHFRKRSAVGMLMLKNE